LILLKEPWLNENKPNKWMNEKRYLKRFEEIIKDNEKRKIKTKNKP